MTLHSIYDSLRLIAFILIIGSHGNGIIILAFSIVTVLVAEAMLILRYWLRYTNQLQDL
jgi:hypothetical protein